MLVTVWILPICCGDAPLGTLLCMIQQTLEHPKQDAPGNISTEQQMSVQHFIAIHKITVELLQLVVEPKNHSAGGAQNPIIAKVTHAGKWKKKILTEVQEVTSYLGI